jgi:hypothetical protein
MLFVAGFYGTRVFSAPYSLSFEERQAIENRKKIEQFHIEISCKHWELYDNPRSPMASVVGRIYYSDGINLRQDSLRKRHVSIKGEEDIYTTIRVLTKDKTVGYLRGVDDAGNRCGVDIKPHGVDAAIPVIDVRKIGMQPSGFMFDFPIDKIIGRSDRKNNVITDDTFNGVPCKKIEYINSESGSKLTYWISPSKGYSVLCMVCNSDGKGKYEEFDTITDCTTVEVAEYKNSGLWFPTRASFTRTNEKTKKIEMKHDFEITVHSLNEPLNPEFFTLKSFGIPVGTDVLIYPDSKDENFYWDGYKISSNRIAAFDDVTEVERSRRLTRILTIVVLNTIAVICLYFYFRSRSNKKQSE